MSFKFCPECGFKLDKEYKFCPECGYKLSQAEKDSKPSSGQSSGPVAKKELTPDELKEFKSGEKLFNNNKEKEAFPILKKYAEKGYAQAQFLVAMCYDNRSGESIFADAKQAAYWYQKSADQGNTDAMCNLSSCYEDGYGVSKDIEKARFWYQKAVDSGDKFAAAFIDEVMERLNGNPVKKKPEKDPNLTEEESVLKAAEEWCLAGGGEIAFPTAKKYAEQGNAKAQWLLGLCYDDCIKKTSYFDLKQAVYWYKKAADQGHTDAMCQLGQCYEYGNGVPEDKKQARYWYQKAFDLGNRGGKDLLDQMEYFGD